jgi:hypothetical protein
MAEIHDLETTDASNTDRFPEGQAPSTVNNGARALEGLIARYFFDNDTSVVATLSDSLITITANRDSLTLTGTTSNYVANFMQAFTMGANPNTGPFRVTIDGVGPISVRDNYGVSLSASILLAGTRALIVKDDANNYFRMLYPFTPRSDWIAGLADTTIATGDLVAFGDVTDGNKQKRDTVQGILDLVTLRVAASQAEMEAASSTSVFVSPGRQKYHPGHPKAWVKANVTGGIIVSYNVTSVTDTGTGRVTVNWATNFSGSNYVVVATTQGTGARLAVVAGANPPAAGTTEIDSYNAAGTLADPSVYHVVALGDQA